MKNRLYSFIGFCISLLIALSLCSGYADDYLRIKDDRPVLLHGKWEFYPGRFVGTAEVLPKGETIEVPSAWKGDKFPGTGYGTYRKCVRVKEGGDLAIRIGFIPTAYKLYVNGKLLGGVGKPAASPEEQTAQWYPKTYIIPGSENTGPGRPLDIRIEVANYSHGFGGLRSSVALGSEKSVKLQNRRRAFKDWILIGAFLFIGIYHLVLFFLQRREWLLGWFAILCFGFAVNSGFNNSVFWNSILPGIPWRIMLRIEYISLYVIVIAFVLFLGKLLNRGLPRRPLQIYVGLFGALIVLALTGPVYWMTLSVRAGHVLIIVAVLWFGIQTGIGVKKKEPYAVPVLIGIIIAAAVTVHDALYFSGKFFSYPLIDYAAIVIIAIQSFAIAERFTGALRRQKELTEDLAAVNERLELMVEEDPVTGLPNRVSLHRNLTDEIARSERSGRALSILFIDLDNFKHVNDTMGHQMGDEILRRVADRMHRVVRKTDRLFRIGGDEFILLCLDLSSPEDALRVARNLTPLLRQTFGVGNREVLLGASIGIAVFPEHGQDATTLLRNADAAMYAAKRAGKGRYSLFTDTMGWKANEHVSVGGRLPRALQANLLSLVFQPQIDTQTMEMVSVEALLRWSDPELGIVPPSRFIPVAEESGLIVNIGRWVLEQTLLICGNKELCNPGINVSINLSAEQLTYQDLVPEFRKILEITRFDPRRLMLEVTEHAVMRNWSISVKTLDALRSLGIKIALDDFGTGYSSLGNIRMVPADQLKIDKSFVNNITRSKRDEQLVRWIVQLGHELELEVCAEGIETLEQQEILLDMSVDLLQGFLYSKPVTDILAFGNVS